MKSTAHLAEYLCLDHPHKFLIFFLSALLCGCQTKLERAKELGSKGNYEEALVTLKEIPKTDDRWLEAFKLTVDYSLSLAKRWADKLEYDSAISVLANVESVDATLFNGLYCLKLAQLLATRQNYNGAVTALIRIPRRWLEFCDGNPKFELAHFLVKPISIISKIASDRVTHTLAGKWIGAVTVVDAWKDIQLTFHADGTYKKSWTAHGSVPFPASLILGTRFSSGAEAGRWTITDQQFKEFVLGQPKFRTLEQSNRFFLNFDLQIVELTCTTSTEKHNIGESNNLQVELRSDKDASITDLSESSFLTRSGQTPPLVFSKLQN